MKINNEIKKLQNQSKIANQNVMQIPRRIRVKEFFPKENAVTIQFVDIGDNVGSSIPTTDNNEHKFALGYRGDVSESMSPQPGDLGFLFYTGMQYKRGFVMLSHTEGGDEAASYVPIRGSWSI